jgi:hypothetical protein
MRVHIKQWGKVPQERAAYVQFQNDVLAYAAEHNGR